MVDTKKQYEYWKAGAAEDWEVAEKLIEDGKIRHGLFFAHLSIEKMLKALVTLHTSDLAPRIHNLMRLAEMAELKADEEQRNLLADMNQFSVEGRYPDMLPGAPTRSETSEYMDRTKKVMEWLTRQF